MRFKSNNIFSSLIFISLLFSQEVIAPGLYGDELFTHLANSYQASNTLGYNNARDIMYSIIDIKDGNQLTGVYSGYTITLDLSQDPSTNAYEQGINCEHTYPQSFGAGSEPMKSDMHHLFPTKSNVNSSRGNDPFQDVIDENTDKWYRNDYYIEYMPTEYINEYAEKYNPEDPTDERFEPREEQKGNTARAMFYFYTIYNDVVSDQSYWDIQEGTCIDWHYDDLPDDIEINRTNIISSYQGNMNPYVIDPSLVGRVFLVSSGAIMGDVNNDQFLDVLDVVAIINYILGESNLNQSSMVVADTNYDIAVDVLDVVSIVQIILN